MNSTIDKGILEYIKKLEEKINNKKRTKAEPP